MCYISKITMKLNDRDVYLKNGEASGITMKLNKSNAYLKTGEAI